MALNQLASALGRRDEVPNQELAHTLAADKDAEGIQEIVDNLGNEDLRIQNDCLKVLYEIGYIEPKLVAPYAKEFLKLLGSVHNRQVWGGMIGLSTIAALQADALFPHVETIQQAMVKGSVITVDAGVLTLAEIAAQDPDYNQSILMFFQESPDINIIFSCPVSNMLGQGRWQFPVQNSPFPAGPPAELPTQGPPPAQR